MTNEYEAYKAADLKSKALDPKWDEAGKVHDWRNYISEKLRGMWDTFTIDQKIALVESADETAGNEEWD